MTHQTEQIHAEQQCYDFFSEPIHYPLIIGNETFVITFQDQRNIVDRRNWFLSRIQSCELQRQPDNAPLQNALLVNLQTLIAHMVQNQASLGSQPACPSQKSYRFHYDKQTDTDDLPYYQNLNRLKQKGKVVKQVHFYVECANKNKATNTEICSQRMDDDVITDDEDMHHMWIQT